MTASRIIFLFDGVLRAKAQIQDDTRRAGTDLEDLEGMVRVFLRNWEDSDTLPSNAARESVRDVLLFPRLHEAKGQLLAFPRHVANFVADTDEFCSKDA